MAPDEPGAQPAGKWRSVCFIATAELLAMALWFSASAVVPQLTQEWGLGEAARSWMSMSVQLGFVVGALGSAMLTLADRISARRLFAACALLGGLLNAGIVLFAGGPQVAILLRLLTGVALAGVYPPGMKLMASWSREDRGFAIGLLVGALTLGSALPHLMSAIPWLGEQGALPSWRTVVLSSSALAVLSAFIVTIGVRSGPHLPASSPFSWRYAAEPFRNRGSRLANFGYLGHMWELYAMWVWVPLLLIAAYRDAGWSEQWARIAGFSSIGVGALGAVTAGLVADRVGRTTTTIASLAVSGLCALSAGFLYGSPGILTGVCVVWGFSVVADSAQFSAAVSELSDARYVGTALTVQTSLGFLLTLLTVRVLPGVVSALGWTAALSVLAVGPAFGIWSMYRLRRLPEAARMASGRR